MLAGIKIDLIMGCIFLDRAPVSDHAASSPLCTYNTLTISAHSGGMHACNIPLYSQ